MKFQPDSIVWWSNFHSGILGTQLRTGGSNNQWWHHQAILFAEIDLPQLQQSPCRPTIKWLMINLLKLDQTGWSCGKMFISDRGCARFLVGQQQAMGFNRLNALTHGSKVNLPNVGVNYWRRACHAEPTQTSHRGHRGFSNGELSSCLHSCSFGVWFLVRLLRRYEITRGGAISCSNRQLMVIG